MIYIYLLSLSGLLVGLNTSLVLPLGFYDSHRIWQVITVILATSYLCFLKFKRINALSSQFFCLFGLLLALVGFSNANSSYRELGFLESLNSIFLLLALVSFSQIWQVRATQKKFEEWIVLLIAFGLLVYFFQMLVAFGAGVYAGTSVNRTLIVHHISNVRFFNHIQVLTLPLLIIFSLRSEFLLSRRLCFCVAVLSVSVLFFLSARAAIASLFVSAFVMLSLIKDRTLVFRYLSTTLAGGLFFLIVFKGIPAFIYGLPEVPLVVNLNSAGRWALWSEGLILLKEHWLLGVGGMQYGYWSQLGFGHPHNIGLQIALEYGVPALFIVLFFVGRFLMRLTRMLRKNEFSSFQIGCCWAFVATLGVAMFSGVWVAPLTQLLLVMIVAPLIGPYISSYKASQPANKAIKLKLPGWSLKFVLLAMIISFVVLLFNEIERHYESIDYSKIEKPLYAPRFWQESSWPKLKANDS